MWLYYFSNETMMKSGIIFTTDAMAYTCQSSCCDRMATLSEFEERNRRREQLGYDPLYLVWQPDDGVNSLINIRQGFETRQAASQIACKTKRLK
jgi:hypothetical protein